MPLVALVTFLLIEFFSSSVAKAGENLHQYQFNKIRIALVFDLSGRREPAIDVVKGIDFAVNELLSQGKKIEIIRFNSESDALGTRKAMQQALADHADVIIAEIDSSKAMIAAEMAEHAGRVMITPYATSPLITSGRKFVFRSCFADDFQGSKLAEFARAHLHARSALIYSDGGQLYSQTLANSFRQRFSELGGKIINDAKIIASSISFHNQIGDIAQLKPDIVFLPVYEQTAARFINEAIVRGVLSSTFLGGDGWGASRTFQDIIFRKKSPVKAYWVSHYSGDFSNVLLGRIAAKYLSSNGLSLNASSAIGYDALMVAVKSVEAAGSDRSQVAIVKALHQLPSFDGLSGNIFFKGSQDPKKSLFIRRIENDKMGFVTELKP